MKSGPEQTTVNKMTQNENISQNQWLTMCHLKQNKRILNLLK